VHERADGALIVDDAYNANPESTAAAVRTLAALARARRSWAVLGHMAELGAAGPAAHVAIGELCARVGIDRVVAVGAGAREIADGAAAAGGTATWFADQEAAGRHLAAEVAPGDVVLVKASRSVGLDRLAAFLRDARTEPQGAATSETGVGR
jgi:UDP-N-acetylmuramoyl-tripeptide--D-alanyl-D-alanine ligase